MLLISQLVTLVLSKSKRTNWIANFQWEIFAIKKTTKFLAKFTFVHGTVFIIHKIQLYFLFKHFPISYCKLSIKKILSTLSSKSVLIGCFGSILPTNLYRFLVWTLLNISFDFSKPLFFEWSIFSKIESVNFSYASMSSIVSDIFNFFLWSMYILLSKSNLQLKIIDYKIFTCFRWVPLFVA